VEARFDRGSKQRSRLLAGRGRALALAVALTLVLVLLASAVFSIAGRSREVASRSVALHSLNESLRAATVVRAQVTFAAYLAENDSAFGTDSRTDIRVAVREAQQNLTELEGTLSQAQPTDTPDPKTQAALARFSTVAHRTLAAAESNHPAGARRLAREQLVPSFVVLRDRLVIRRDDALGDVKRAGSLLGRLGGLASFVIAFVLPTLAVLVYRQIMRRSRESIELARSLAVERGRAKRRQHLLAQSLARLEGEIVNIEATDGDARAPLLRRLGWEVDAVGTVIAGTRKLAFSNVDLFEQLTALAATLRDAGLEVGVTSADGTAWTDPAVLGAAVRNLVLEAENAGARRIELGSSTNADRVEITVAHDGAALAPDLASLVFDRAHEDERTAVEAGAAPIRLLAAQNLIEAMGGSLAPVVFLGRPAYVAHLPRATDRVDIGPIDAKTAAPAPS